MSESSLKYIHLDELTVSPLNQRKTLHQESIDETAESILTHGVIQPPLVRVMEGLRYELLCGQRRFHASYRAVAMAEERGLAALHPERALPNGELPVSRAAELEWLGVIVRAVNDREAEEIMIIENLHREDVSPREEAAGYARLLELLDDDGCKLYTLETLAAKLGKSRRYLGRRLRLRLVPEVLWDALELGRISTRHLELVGSVPHPKTREEVAKKILDPKLQDHPLTVVQTQELIRENYVVSLKGCGFDLKDDALVSVEYKGDERIMGGSCADCPYRTGNDPELRAELMQIGGDKRSGKGGIDPNLCTNTRCFVDKQEAVWRRLKAHAEDGGTRVLDVDKTSSIFASWGDMSVIETSGLVDLSARPGYQATGNHASEDQAETWDELLNGTEAVAKIIMARHPVTKRVHRLVELETAVVAAEKKLKEEDKPNIFANRPQKVTRAKVVEGRDWERENAERTKEANIRAVAYGILREAMADKLCDPAVKTGKHEVWRALMKAAFFTAVFDGPEAVLELLEIEDEEVAKIYDPEELWPACEARLNELAAGGNEIVMVARLIMLMVMPKWKPMEENEVLQDIVRALGIDLEEVEARARRMVTGEVEEETMEERVQRILNGESYAEVLGKAPAKGTPEHKEHERKRVALVRAVKAAGVVQE
jgi:ParB-like chromosome segregation protein Spo0J